MWACRAPANRDELLIHPLRGGGGVAGGNLQHACGIAAGRHRRAIAGLPAGGEHEMADPLARGRAAGCALRFASNPATWPAWRCGIAHAG
jgi:hypothetical protein